MQLAGRIGILNSPVIVLPDGCVFPGYQDVKTLFSMIGDEAFLAENKKKEGVITLPSGLQYKVLKEGTGKIPTDTKPPIESLPHSKRRTDRRSGLLLIAGY
jgi:hypothetical protein